MTALADAPASTVGVGPDQPRRTVARHLPEAACLLAAAWWLLEVTRAWAGRDAGPVTIGAILVAVAVVATRPARWLPIRVVVAVTLLSAGALLVAATSPTGWAGAPVAASYVCSGWLALCCAATVRRTPGSAPRLVGLVLLAGLVEVAEAWLPWWGGEDPSHPMIGTFYWHDPYAAFLLPVAVLGLWSWTRGPRALAALGLAGFAASTVGIVYSTSRAALACLAIGTVAVAAVAVRGRRWHRVLGRAVAAVAVAVGVTYLIAGPPFFPHRSAFAAGIQQRAAGQSLGQNGGYRLEFWHEAVNLFTRKPVTGGGYHSLVTESVGHVPHGWALSPFAHNGYLQALSDGGVLLALPFLGLCAALAWAAARGYLSGLRRASGDSLSAALGCAVAVVMAHSFVDFDWTYAANLALFGVLAGVLVGCRPAATQQPGRRVSSWVIATGTLAVAALALSAWGARGGDRHENLHLHAASAQAVQASPGTGR